MELIAGQLAVSLDNALHHDSLGNEVRTRTMEIADRNASWRRAAFLLKLTHPAAQLRVFGLNRVGSRLTPTPSDGRCRRDAGHRRGPSSATTPTRPEIIGDRRDPRARTR
ncbi:hypothetical protein Aca07nite_86930 [Actinoplanes capillaceus]|uniref:Uncharacterized protein n=1 Tax=Actinoplanes campanulatus TaxID=113559 RepID=A0ABQ3WYS1_9ACTN|nr:hypothetical protein Aca07nite_86930 [Actinoplanes capillaceus]